MKNLRNIGKLARLSNTPKTVVVSFGKWYRKTRGNADAFVSSRAIAIESETPRTCGHFAIRTG